MKKGFDIEVPSLVENQLTGLIIRATKSIRNSLWMVEYWRDGLPRLYKNYNSVEWLKASAAARKFAHEVANFVNSQKGVQS